MNSYNTIIFVDWGNTCDRDDSKPLLDRLQELNYNGYSIYLATDGDAYDAKSYNNQLKNKGYAFFESEIHQNTFNQKKNNPEYWNSVKAMLGDKKYFILLDDFDENIKTAAKNGVETISVSENRAMRLIVQQLNSKLDLT